MGAKTTKKPDGSGPLERLLPMFESSYAPLHPQGEAPGAIATVRPWFETPASAFAEPGSSP